MDSDKIIGSKAYFFSTVLLAILTLYVTSLFVGQNDTITYVIFWTITVALTVIVYQIRNASRAVTAIYFKPGSFLHSFFTNDKFSLVNLIISFIISIPLSFLFVLMAKGLMLNHEPWQVILAMSISAFIYIYMSRNYFGQTKKIVENNIADDAQENTLNIFSVFIISIAINIFISLFFSIPDYVEFSNDNSTFNEIQENLNNKSLKLSDKINFETNSGKVAVFYLMVDNIKIIIANEAILIFGSLEEKRDTDYWLFFVIYAFIVNMIKLFGFSITFVLLMRLYSKYLSASVAILLLKTEVFANEKTEKYFNESKKYLAEKKEIYFNSKKNDSNEVKNDKN